MIKLIKEFFTAFYDPSTDQIRNCTPGSFIYLHEEGHQKQQHSGILSQIQMWLVMSLIGAVACLSVELYSISRIFVAIMLGLYAYPEIDAWIYATRKYKEKKNE